MRLAIINTLCNIDDFENRVFQPFVAADGTATPYCVTKLKEDPAVNNKRGSFFELQVMIYASPNNFADLDDLEMQVRALLHNQTIETSDSPPRYFIPEYDRTLPDWHDEKRNLFVKIIYFRIPLTRA